MPYIGNPISIGNLTQETFNGNATIYTLSYSVGSNASIAVYISGVHQVPTTDYSVSGTTLTFTSTTPAGTANISVTFLSLPISLPVPGDDTVPGAKIVDDAINSEHYTAGSIDTAHIADVNVTEGKIADNAITLAKMAHGTDGNIITFDAAGAPAAVATGSSGQVLTSGGAGVAPTFATAAGGGVIVQSVDTQTGTFATTTTQTPLDNTSPLVSEGSEFMTLAITPTSASNDLQIDVTIQGGASTTRTVIVTLVNTDIDATNCLAAGAHYTHGTNTALSTTLRHTVSSPGTSATTFSVRIGLGGAGTFYFNGTGAAMLNGLHASTITIKEISV